MIVNNARSVSEALHQGLHLIRVQGVAKPSRVGDVLVSPRPVMTEYKNPMNRVLTSPMRDANPFFHVMETLWMLAGRNDLPWLVRFNKKFSSYSDDGGLTQPGAYGYRWRNYFGHDQLADTILELKQNPDSRRVVITMWDGGSRRSWLGGGAGGMQPDGQQPGDFFAAVGGSADVPCNTHIYFDTIDGRLNMTVCCRSNDIIWGAYGANAVHFSFLLEYLSAMTGIPMGVYRQFSNNFHLYTNIVPREQLIPMASNVERTDLYLVSESRNSSCKLDRSVRQVPLVSSPEYFEKDLYGFMAAEYPQDRPYGNSFFNDVAAPMFAAYMAFKAKEYDLAIDTALNIKAEDWRTASVEWLERRKLKAEINKVPFTEVAAAPIPAPVEDNAFGLERSDDGTA